MKNIVFLLPRMIYIAVLFANCHWDDIGEPDTEIKPGTATLPVTAHLLTNAQAQMLRADAISGLYCQYFTRVQYTDLALYAYFNREWSDVYAGPLLDLETIIKLNTDVETRDRVLASGSNNNQLAAARILKVYYMAQLTDTYGDIPYSEALKGNLAPGYDPQAEVYRSLLTELKEAVEQFDNGPAPEGDVLWNGRIEAWQKFANSLRLILALRISKADPSLAMAECNAALQAEGGLIENPEDAVILFPDGLSNFVNPWPNVSGFDFYAISKTIVDIMEGSVPDPRLSCFGLPNDQGKVIGVPYGLTNDSVAAFTLQHPDWSYIFSDGWYGSTIPFFVLTPAHVYLARAEAAQRGWTGEDAETLYRAGIRTSWEQWKVFDQNLFDTYMDRADVSLAGGDALQRIGTQRWIAYFPDGLQGWCEWRRTGFPALQPTPWALNLSGQIPRRYIYPNSEQNLNRAAYEAAVARMGGDRDDVRMWWDK